MNEGVEGGELMRVWGQGARVAEQQQKQQPQQRKIDNDLQSDLCCVCDSNHAQVAFVIPHFALSR